MFLHSFSPEPEATAGITEHSMSKTMHISESYSQTLQEDEARDHDRTRGITLPSGAYMLQQENCPSGDSGQRMQELIAGLAKALVDNPESVSVEVIPEATCTVLRLRVAANDIGKVIGKRGRTARSIRTILSAASMKLQHRFALDIVEVGLAKPVQPSECPEE
jgi:predicted RNA-binding protein YlqC (UPF0109 family)